MTLSNVPSTLIKQALADLRVVEKTPNYRVDMRTFITKTDSDLGNKICTVCLAGAAAAARLPKARELIEKPNTQFYSSEFFDQVSYDDKLKMYALDSFRQGEVIQGINELQQCSDTTMDGSEDFHDLDRGITPYEVSKEKFHKQMEKLAKDLESRGL